eukprot:6182467-Pleurochrysis_carterae.AAC.1
MRLCARCPTWRPTLRCAPSSSPRAGSRRSSRPSLRAARTDFSRRRADTRATAKALLLFTSL